MVGNADILEYAKRTQTFTCKQMLSDFTKDGKIFSPNTIASSLRRLVSNSILMKSGRGLFSMPVSGKLVFSAFYNEEMDQIEEYIKTQFPFIRFCVWNSYDVKRFSHYVANMDVVFVDVERDCEEAVFGKLLAQFPNRQVYLKPDQDCYSNYIYGNPTIVVRTLISEAPLVQLSDNRTRVSLEKVLVDSAIDDDFISFQGYESLRLFRNAFDVCLINESKLLRYARRRSHGKEIQELITEVKNNKIFD